MVLAQARFLNIIHLLFHQFLLDLKHCLHLPKGLLLSGVPLQRKLIYSVDLPITIISIKFLNTVRVQFLLQAQAVHLLQAVRS